jgi:hypothetical protein
MASLEATVVVLSVDEAVQNVIDAVLPQLRQEYAGQVEALNKVVADLGQQINQLRRAVEANDRRLDNAHMRMNVLTNKTTSIDNRLATHNNTLVGHSDALEGLFTDLVSLKGRVNEVVAWQAGHEDEQDQVEQEVSFQLVDLRRRATALENIAISHDRRLGEQAELHAERQAKADQFDLDLATRLAVVERTLLAQIDAAADVVEAVANLTTQTEQLDDRTSEALTELEARVADLEDDDDWTTEREEFWSEPTEAAAPPKPIYGSGATITFNGVEVKPKLSNVAFDFKIDEAVLKAYRASIEELNSKLFRGYLEPSAFGPSFRMATTPGGRAVPIVDTPTPVEPKPRRCANGCCVVCTDLGRRCCNCGAQPD